MYPFVGIQIPISPSCRLRRRWGSLWRWILEYEPDPLLLSAWPMARLPNWAARLNEPLTEQETNAIRRYICLGSALADAELVQSTKLAGSRIDASSAEPPTRQAGRR